eukprot:CAMPEP_0174830652 /NCGR_PEP_ID=MMETSP1114-20130205/2641_1 /TAXON_ID=312471 /ORGANISM="Neobodo designis, Strain CCAP 1951/1" /LENGTH=253 /DNA_ID=CAMNT_0016064455 /DNA_START=77 /DNA_END=835 /DNA_ORIENTATION=-
MSEEDATFLRESEALARRHQRQGGSAAPRMPPPSKSRGEEGRSEGLAHMPEARLRAAQEAARELTDTKRRRDAEQLREHLKPETRKTLETIHKERQAVVLMGLKKQIEILRETAQREHTRLLETADRADEATKQNRAAIAAFIARSDAELVPEVEASVLRAIERQQAMERHLKGRASVDRTAVLIAVGLTALILGFVIWAGIHLSESRNLYRFLKAVYRVWDAFWPGSRKGTLFSEPGDGSSGADEYATTRSR